MAQSYVQAYRPTSSGSVVYEEKPVGLSTGAGSPYRDAAVSVAEEPGAATRVTLTFTALAIPVTDDSTAGGHANLAIYTCPKGLTLFTGANVDLTLTGGAGLTATSAVVASLGTDPAAVDNAVLASTEANIIASTACTLTDNAGTFSAVNAAAIAPYDGRTTAKIVYLNFATPDAGITGATTMTVSGTIKLSYIIT